MSTVLVISLALGVTVLSILLWAFLLYIGLRWAKVRDVSARRVALATVVVIGIQSALDGATFIAWQVLPTGGTLVISLAAAKLAGLVLIPCFVIMWIFQIRFVRSLQAWLLPTIGVPVGAIALAVLVVRPFLFEAFSIPTNAMAPTVLGRHWVGTCADCGSPAFGSPIPPQYASSEAAMMICAANFHVARPAKPSDREFSGDHILVAKYLKPQRWDLVVFRYPEDPDQFFVMRLVGLPGEEITIRDGSVWVNSQRLTPPPSISGIKYLSELDGWHGILWGAPESPAKLADDEYFVFGDFSARSKDSRIWLQGAPGHNPFAVPESYMHGVVTHIYWPPHRWRTFR